MKRQWRGAAEEAELPVEAFRVRVVLGDDALAAAALAKAAEWAREPSIPQHLKEHIAELVSAIPPPCSDEHVSASGTSRLRPLRDSDRRAYEDSIDDEVRYWQGWNEARRNPSSASVVNRTGRCPTRQAVTLPDADLLLGVYAWEPLGQDLRRSVGATEASACVLGWWLAPQARGRGIGRESLGLALRYAHEHLAVREVWMGTSQQNVRAIAQIEAVGAARVAETPHRLPNRKRVTACWYRHAETTRGDKGQPESS